MRAGGDNAPGLHHQDTVGPAHRGQAMRHHQRGAAARGGRQGLLHRLFALGIERAGRLIEQQDGRVAQDGAGDGDALALAAGEGDAAGTEMRCHALRQGGDKISRCRRPGCRQHGGVIGLGPAIADILGHGGGEDHRLLRHQAQAAAQGLGLHQADIGAIDQHAAGLRVAEAQQQLQHRGLARAGGADQGDRFSWFQRERYVAECWGIGAGGVVETDAFKGHAALRRRQDGGAGGGSDFGLCGQDFEQAVSRCGGALHLAPDFGNRRQRTGQKDGVEDEG